MAGEDVLKSLLPLINFAGLAATQGKPTATGYAQGLTEATQYQQGLDLQQQQLGLQQQRVQAQLAAQQEAAEARRRQEARLFTESAIDRAMSMPDRDSAFAYLRSMDQLGSSRGTTRPGELLRTPLPRQFFTKKEQDRHEKTLQTYIDSAGIDQFNEAIAQPPDLQPQFLVNGRRVPLEEFAAQFANRAVDGSTGELIPIEGRSPKTDFERRLQYELDAFEATEGRKPSKAEKARLAREVSGFDSIEQTTNLLRAQMLALQLRIMEREATGMRPSTQQEKSAVAFANRAESSHLSAIQLEDRVAPATTWLPNLLQPEDTQLYVQAQREFTEARLRKESGAAVPQSEYDNDARTYFAKPGDTPAVIRQKQIARARVLQGIAFQSGPAWIELKGTPFDYTQYVPSDEALPTLGDESSAESAVNILFGNR